MRGAPNSLMSRLSLPMLSLLPKVGSASLLVDNDGNGCIDAFIVIHAGSGAEVIGNTNDIWSVKWVLPSITPINDVNVYAFLTIPEDAVIGVSCHELGHLVFGWPGLYDTDDSSDDIGNWWLMSGGTRGGFPQGTRRSWRARRVGNGRCLSIIYVGSLSKHHVCSLEPSPAC